MSLLLLLLVAFLGGVNSLGQDLAPAAVYSNNNVNLGNLGGIREAEENQRDKLQGPNVCIKQEP